METAEKYLKGLSEFDEVFDITDDDEYSESQLINFAESYATEKVKEVLNSNSNKYYEDLKEAFNAGRETNEEFINWLASDESLN